MAAHDTFATRADPVLVRMPDGCRIAARAFGREAAPPVLFVAGGDGTMLQWRSLIPELCLDSGERELFAAAGGWEAGVARSLATDLRVVAYDARGTGWSSRSHGVCTTTGAAAADALALMGAISGRRFHLVGHGLGAAVALQLALAAGRLVASLTLVAGTAGGDAFVPPDTDFLAARAALASALERLRGDTNARQTALAELAGLVRRDVELGFAPSFVATHPSLVEHLSAEAHADLLRESVLDRRGASGTTAAAARGEQFATHDVAARLGDLGTPALVVSGDGDKVLPPGNSQRLAALVPGARLVSLDAGHMVTVERAADVAAAVCAHVLLHP